MPPARYNFLFLFFIAIMFGFAQSILLFYHFYLLSRNRTTLGKIVHCCQPLSYSRKHCFGANAWYSYHWRIVNLVVVLYYFPSLSNGSCQLESCAALWFRYEVSQTTGRLLVLALGAKDNIHELVLTYSKGIIAGSFHIWVPPLFHLRGMPSV